MLIFWSKIYVVVYYSVRVVTDCQDISLATTHSMILLKTHRPIIGYIVYALLI